MESRKLERFFDVSMNSQGSIGKFLSILKVFVLLVVQAWVISSDKGDLEKVCKILRVGGSIN